MLRNTLLIPVVLLALAGCRQGQDIEIPFLPGFGPHKIEIQQGNVVTQEMVEKLQAGMTRNQVRFVLGTPLLVDPFRADRWDYVYELSKRGERVERRQLKVYFKEDRLVRYEGDLPLEKPLLDAAGKPVPAPAPQPVVGPAINPDFDKPAPAAPAPAAAATAAPAAPPVPIGDPQLRLSPSEGKPATPEERAATTTATPAKPATESQPLEAPPLPRIQLPQDDPETPARAEKPAVQKP